MADEVAELHELAERYRHRAKAIGIPGFAEAFDEAADQLEERIKLMDRSSRLPII